MDSDHIISAHGGAMSTADMLVGLGPVILGAVLIGIFILLLSTDRSPAARAGWRDETPTSARLLFSGTYYQLEELLKYENEEPSATPHETAGAR